MTMSTAAGGIAIGGVTGASIVLAEIAVTGHTQIPIESAVGIAVFACGLIWWIGRKFQSIDDKLDSMQKRLDTLPCKDPTKPC